MSTFCGTDSQLLRLGQARIAVGLVLLLAPLPNAAAMMGLMVCGLGCAPIYPSIIHSTPENFGASNALALTGLQMVFAYVGSLVMSPLFGVLAEGVSLAIYPFYLAALLAVMALMAEAVNRVCRRAGQLPRPPASTGAIPGAPRWHTVAPSHTRSLRTRTPSCWSLASAAGAATLRSRWLRSPATRTPLAGRSPSRRASSTRCCSPRSGTLPTNVL